jgi:MOSC domain-containing protein YiiM
VKRFCVGLTLIFGVSCENMVLKLRCIDVSRQLRYLSKEKHMEGKIVAVCIGTTTGERKRPVPWITLQRDHGVSGDAHAGDGQLQVSLLASESIKKLQSMGLPVSVGDFAENIVTSGLNLMALTVGARLKVGAALLEVTQVGRELHAFCSGNHQAGDSIMPKVGVFVRVLHGGEIKPGDRIALEVTKRPALQKTTAVRGVTKRRTLAICKGSTKSFVISMRISDDEMLRIQELMQVTNKGASELMREALHLFKPEYALTRMATVTANNDKIIVGDFGLR